MKWLGAGGVAGLAGCSTSEETPTPDDETPGAGTTPTDTPTPTPSQLQVGGEFIDATTSTGGAPHPLRIDDTTTFARLEKLYDVNGQAVGPETFGGLLFAEMNISDSFDVVEYTIRDGLEWGADYGQLDADDYMYLLNEIVLNTGDDDWYGFTDTQFYRIGPDQELISYEKTGPLSIRAELPVSKPQWLHESPFLSQVPLPKGLLEQYVPDQDREGLDQDEDIVNANLADGNLGPYRLVSRESGSRWQYERNPDYYLKDHADEAPYGDDPYFQYDEAPYFEAFRYQYFGEAQAALAALEAGEVTEAGIPDQQVARIRGRDDITLYESRFDNGVFWLNLNHRINTWAPIRESREVRRALAHLWNKDYIINNIANGLAVPLSTFHPSWGPFYPPEEELYEPEGSLERARELLEEGTSSDYGYDGDTFVGPDGEQVTLKGVRTTGNPTTERSASYMQQRLEQAGIQLNIEAHQWQSLLQNYAMNSVDNVEGVSESDLPDWAPIGLFNGGPWDMAASANDWSLMFGLGFSTSPYAPWSAVKSTMAEKGTFNLWGYSQDEFDIIQTIDEASTATDPSVTQERMTELFAFLSRDMPVVWTNSGYNVNGFSGDLVGFAGRETEDGYEATNFFKQFDQARLLGFAPE